MAGDETYETKRMKTQVHIVVGLLSVAFLTSCDPAPRGSDLYDENPTRYSFKSSDEKAKALQDWKIKCLSESDCPETVGQLVSDVSSTEVSLCTAFLLNDQKTIATNSHCVTDLVGADSGGSLLDHARVIFPASNSKPQQIVRVAKLLSTSKKSQFTDPDLALLELESAVGDRKALKLDRSGVADQELLKIVKVNPSQDPRGMNTLEVQTCRVIVQPFFLTNFQEPTDPAVAITDCEVLHGNSGSPMISRRGDVKAVMFGTAETTEQVIGYGYSLTRQTREPFNHPDLRGRHFNYATNATCFTESPLAIDTSSCTRIDKASREKNEKARQQQALFEPVIKAATEMSEWAVTNSKFGVWTMETINDVSTNIEYKYSHGSSIQSAIRPKLACIQPIANWGTQFKKTSILHWNPYVDIARPQAKLPRYFFKMAYDSSLRPFMKVEKDFETLRLRISPSELSKDKGGRVSLGRANNGFVDVEAPGEFIKPCGSVIKGDQIRAAYTGKK